MEKENYKSYKYISIILLIATIVLLLFVLSFTIKFESLYKNNIIIPNYLTGIMFDIDNNNAIMVFDLDDESQKNFVSYINELCTFYDMDYCKTEIPI